jgi:hypothetical protein
VSSAHNARCAETVMGFHGEVGIDPLLTFAESIKDMEAFIHNA